LPQIVHSRGFSFVCVRSCIAVEVNDLPLKERFKILTACALLRECFATMLAFPWLLPGVEESVLLH
jgi:hypothetical protein